MILVVVEQSKDEVSKQTLSVLQAAKELAEKNGGIDISVLLIGDSDNQKSISSLSSREISKIFTVKSESLKNYVLASYLPNIAELAGKLGAKYILFAANSFGKDMAPRLSAKLGAAQVSDVLEVLSDGQFKRPMYAGNIIATVRPKLEKVVCTIRTVSFEPLALTLDGSSEIIESNEVSSQEAYKMSFVSFAETKSERPELVSAKVVVSGGRALKSTESFNEIMEPLADKLNAAIGASRAAVDAGYAPNDWQVGQTGKVVAPDLYIAVGISGAIQHVAGMKDSKVIVAINKDKEAPIFEVADYGLVADLYEAVPDLVKKLPA